MQKRFVSIWFPYLLTDWFTIRQPELKNKALVLSAPAHGKAIITAINPLAETQGIYTGMAVADARAIFPSIIVQDDKEGLAKKLLNKIAEWCIRFTPVVAVDGNDGLIFDASGCSHIWNGDENYLATIIDRLQQRGYHVRASMADTWGAAWAITRFYKNNKVIPVNEHQQAILQLSPAALRIDSLINDRLQKLGIRQISQLISMPRTALRRRFGTSIIQRLNQALGYEEEIIEPVIPVVPFQERLHALEPIITATGIQIALQQLLEQICTRLQKEQKGIRLARFTCFRTDNKTEQLEIGTHRASHNANHLFKLFEIKIETISPGPGIELFILDAIKIDDHIHQQEKIWEAGGGLADTRIAELLDRIICKSSNHQINRYLPDEHYWPERSYKKATSIEEKPASVWKVDKPRPTHLLNVPERIEVTAPVPDYPPMLFRHKGVLHKIIKADGPERIEQEWWLQQGEHRDYYSVEDEEGKRYWLFRSGHYQSDRSYHWFLHGFFA
jgi:protein ImuB